MCHLLSSHCTSNREDLRAVRLEPLGPVGSTSERLHSCWGPNGCLQFGQIPATVIHSFALLPCQTARRPLQGGGRALLQVWPPEESSQRSEAPQVKDSDLRTAQCVRFCGSAGGCQALSGESGVDWLDMILVMFVVCLTYIYIYR